MIGITNAASDILPRRDPVPEGVQLNTPSTQRILWVDIAKGLLIALMVFGHCGAPFTRVAYMFHMAGFIFLAGYTAGPERQRLPGYIWKRARGLLLPYVFWNVAFILLYRALAGWGIYILFPPEQTFPSVLDFFRYGAAADLGGATWFLPVIFTVAVGYQVLYALLDRLGWRQLTPWVAMMIGLAGFRFCRAGHTLPYMLDLSLTGTLFYGMGHLSATARVLEERIPIRNMTVISVTALVVYGCMYPDILVNWPTRNFPDLVQFLLASVCGIWLCYQAAAFLSRYAWIKRPLSFLGQNTLTVLILHFAVFRVVFFLLVLVGLEPVSYLRNFLPQGDLPLLWLTVGLGTLAICGCAAWLADATGLRLLQYLVTGKARRSR